MRKRRTRPARESTSARGRRGEERAADYLRAHGLRVVERNFRCRLGEIDIIARDGETLIFVEVRTRRSARHGDPLETVGVHKQRRLARVAAFYLSRRAPSFDTCRFDVVGIVNERVEHVKDAFRLGLYQTGR